MAVLKTPERSLPDLFSNSRAARGDDGMDAGLAEMRRSHHGARASTRSAASGSDRKDATPASVLSSSA